ncbi:MAG: helix-turn-helix transcriptional regulator, partial [Alistipes sp.]|nr:helix-turn-helix transcriptional regulator [Alistipes sp.]
MNNAAPRIAILTVNTLTGLGLRTIIEKIIPMAEVCLLRSFDEVQEAGADGFFHYFIDSQTFVEHGEFFGRNRHKTILLTSSVQP